MVAQHLMIDFIVIYPSIFIDLFFTLGVRGDTSHGGTDLNGPLIGCKRHMT